MDTVVNTEDVVVSETMVGPEAEIEIKVEACGHGCSADVVVPSWTVVRQGWEQTLSWSL